MLREESHSIVIAMGLSQRLCALDSDVSPPKLESPLYCHAPPLHTSIPRLPNLE